MKTSNRQSPVLYDQAHGPMWAEPLSNQARLRLLFCQYGPFYTPTPLIDFRYHVYGHMGLNAGFSPEMPTSTWSVTWACTRVPWIKSIFRGIRPNDPIGTCPIRWTATFLDIERFVPSTAEIKEIEKCLQLLGFVTFVTISDACSIFSLSKMTGDWKSISTFHILAH